MIHHGSCPCALAWDIPNVPCTCPRGWPRHEKPKVAGKPSPAEERAIERAILDMHGRGGKGDE